MTCDPFWEQSRAESSNNSPACTKSHICDYLRNIVKTKKCSPLCKAQVPWSTSIGIIVLCFLNNEGWERISNMQIEITPRSPPLGRDWAHMNHFQWKSFRLNLSNSVTNNSEERATRVFVLLDYIHSARNRFIERKWFLKPAGAHGPDGEDYTQHQDRNWNLAIVK